MSADNRHDLLEAQKLFSKAWAASTNNFNQIFSFRHVARLGLPSAAATVMRETTDFISSMFTEDEYKDIFIDRDVARAALGPPEKMARPMVTKKMKDFQEAVDATSAVFSHSILDATAFDFCRVTSLANPALWEDIVSRKQLSLADIKGGDYHTLLKQKVSEHLAQLERESLIKKVDRLFAICQPNADFSPIRDFSYDRDRLHELDRLRHDIIHGNLFSKSIEISDSDISYYFSIANYLMAMLNERFDFKINPDDLIART